MLKKCLSGIMMAACLLVALASGTQIAMADGGLPPAGTNTLTVSATNSQDEAFVADVAKADVVVDVYQVAEAKPAANGAQYDYVLVAPFGSGTLDYSNMDADDWMALATEAAKVVTADTGHQTVAADGATPLTLPDDGLYLLLAHGKPMALAYGPNIADSLLAKGEVNQYYFLPTLVVAPTKEADADGVIRPTSPGEWLRAIDVTIKPGYEPAPTPPDKTTPPGGKGVKTGDDAELLPYYVAMTVSGVLLVLIAIGAIRRRKAGRTD